MMIVFSGSFIVTLESSRHQYNNQLLAHAQDAATALGVSLTPNVNDPAMIELMVSSIFDSGYYQKIRIVDLTNGTTMLERHAAASIPDVPGWFVDLVDVVPQTGNATIMRGWQQAARVEVTSDPIFAVQRLWSSTVGNLVWMLSCSLACLLAGVMLLRKLLRPLNYLAKQSEAITRREFLTLPELPKTPELRRVVAAMNLMATKLKSLFEEQAIYSERLHNEAYLDSQTGIANRRAFDMQLQARLSDADTAPGYLMLVRVQDLGGLNQRFGGPHTDKLLLNIAPGKLALSISGSSVTSARAISDLLNPLKYAPKLAGQLILELDENQLPGPNQMAMFVKAVSQYRCSLGLQHFGSRFDMIGHLSQWGLAYLKIDSSYIRHIDKEKDKRLFIEVLCNATRSIDLPLIAERVETAGELKVLQELGVDGAMGQLLGKPAPL